MDVKTICRLEPGEVSTSFGTSEQGLTAAEAQARINRYGRNSIPQAAHLNLLRQFLSQFTHFMALALWAAGFLAIVAGLPELAYATWAVIVTNALFAFFQEYRADKALARLAAILPRRVKVIRNGELLTIPAEEITVGDSIEIEAGDSVPADARVIATNRLLLDNSLLTGESVPVERSAKAYELGSQNVTESLNLVFAGTSVVAGKARAVVYAVGSRTEIGKVSKLTQTIRRGESTLEQQVQNIVKFITKVALALGGLAFMIAVFGAGLEVKVGFVFAIGIIVANMPEGLLPTVSLSLAVSVQRMAQQNALIRRLSAVENLSAASVICTDKTGTITENQLTLKQVWSPSATAEFAGSGYERAGAVVLPNEAGRALIEMILTAGAVCSEANLAENRLRPEEWRILGTPTEGAILVAAEKIGIGVDRVRSQFQRLDTVPFSSEHKRMSVEVVNLGNGSFPSGARMIFTKGAPLEVAAECDYYHQEKEVREITDEIRSEIVAANDTIAGDGFRVLAVSCQILEPAPARRIFLGLTAMADPPRPEVYEAVKQCAKAGIKVTIITGDYGITAASIARQVGLIDRGFLSITGPELDGKTDEALEQLLQHRQPIIFSRTTPEHKLRIVEAYKRIGEIVAVTGDGVNDTLALKASHVGIAMGIGGTDVAREVSDMVLLDNNFATIIRAVEEGRAVYSNIRKFLTYIMTSNVAEFAPFFAMLFIKIPPALNILQILAIDLGTDILPALALGAERPEKGILSEQPDRFRKNLLDKSLFLRSYGFLGLIEGALAIGFFLYTWFNAGYNLSELRFLTDVILANRAPADLSSLYQYSTTMALAAIIASQIGNVYVCRSERLSIRDTIAGKNHLIAVGIGFELLLAMAIIYLPALQEIFDTQAIAAADLKILMICPLIMIGLEELRKYISAR